MIKELKIVHFGDPRGQARPRAAVRGGHVHMYSPKSEWFNGLVVLASQNQPITTNPADPLVVTITCYFKRPNWHFKGKNRTLRESAPYWYTRKPDVDNTIKSVLDALQQGGVYPDDKQVFGVKIIKKYVQAEETPKTEITIKTL